MPVPSKAVMVNFLYIFFVYPDPLGRIVFKSLFTLSLPFFFVPYLCLIALYFHFIYLFVPFFPPIKVQEVFPIHWC